MSAASPLSRCFCSSVSFPHLAPLAPVRQFGHAPLFMPAPRRHPGKRLKELSCGSRQAVRQGGSAPGRQTRKASVRFWEQGARRASRHPSQGVTCSGALGSHRRQDEGKLRLLPCRASSHKGVSSRYPCFIIAALQRKKEEPCSCTERNLAGWQRAELVNIQPPSHFPRQSQCHSSDCCV